MKGLAFAGALLALALLLVPVPAARGAPLYTPVAGDDFHYSETIEVNQGVGNYTGYTDQTDVAGNISVLSVHPNGTEAADYQYTSSWADNEGHSQTISSAGNFTFSAVTYRYVQGTDNQTGYTDPYVWFLVNAELGLGATFYLLNTMMTVTSLNASYPAPGTSTGYAKGIEGAGSGSYQRDDSYGRFTATYSWNAFFDPTTGYIVGYRYDETDRNGSNGFTYTDTLGLTSASYALQSAAAPPASSASPAASGLEEAFAITAIFVVILIVIVVAVVVAARRRSRLPRHSGPMGAAPVAWGPPPPPIGLSGGSGPAPQVVLRETVKVNCRYCGTLMDSTDTVCPKCGAPRT